MCRFSVLMSVYKNEEPLYFAEAMDSILMQTVLPSEIILIRDGIVPESLQIVIDDFLEKSTVPITYIPLLENRGLGNALRVGVQVSSNELIARMDSDDVSVPDRFELQISEFKSDQSLDLLGGQVLEFENNVAKIVGKRNVPLSHEQIAEYLKRRNAFNHPTVMFKRSAVLLAGNYADRHFVEDYDLWCRMLSKRCRFRNLSETLVYMRVSPDMYKRRGGIKYFESLKKLERDKLNAGLINWLQYSTNIIVRFVQCIFLCGDLRKLAYQRVLRN